MAFLAGETITAGRLNRLQPKLYHATGTGLDIGALQDDVDVPGLSIPVSVGTAGATYQATIAVSFYNISPSGAVGSARLYLDNLGVGVFGVYADADNSGKATVVQTYQGTISTAGSHTFKVVATTPGGQTIKTTFSTFSLIVSEIA